MTVAAGTLSALNADPQADRQESKEQARCWICGHPLYADASVRLGIGPHCWSQRMGGPA